MANNISFRDVVFTPSDGFVRVDVLTDVECHLWARLTETEPQIHQKSIERRGLPIMTEFRYCFVAYNDYEQIEAGDTFTHSWIFLGWSFCKTKWLYFWGTRSVIVSPSTSPTFKFHNLVPVGGKVMTIIFTEPWTHSGDPLPDFYQRIIEFWGEPDPSFNLKILEPWTS